MFLFAFIIFSIRTASGLRISIFILKNNDVEKNTQLFYAVEMQVLWAITLISSIAPVKSFISSSVGFVLEYLSIEQID